MAGHTTKARNYRMKHTQAVAHQLAKVLAESPEVLAHSDIETAPDAFRQLVATKAGRDRKYIPSDWTWKLAVGHAKRLVRKEEP